MIQDSCIFILIYSNILLSHYFYVTHKQRMDQQISMAWLWSDAGVTKFIGNVCRQPQFLPSLDFLAAGHPFGLPF